MAVRQGRHWSSTLIWISAAIFGGAVIWAFNAKVDQTITVAGRLSLRAVWKKSTYRLQAL